MSLHWPAIRALLQKELRQISRSRRAMVSAILLPVLLMVVVPVSQFFSLQSTGRPSRGGFPLTGGAANAGEPMQLFTQLMLPLFIALGGVIVPSVSAAYTVVAEREKGSLELLISLPASVGDILTAKLLSVLMMASIAVLPLFALDAAGLLISQVAGPAYVVMLLLVLLGALTCSVGIALVMALLVRDFRTANNLNGAFVVPIMIVSSAILIAIPGDVHLLVLAVVLALFGGMAFMAGLRWLTFERYLA